MMVPLFAYVATFSEQVNIQKIYFFAVSTPSEQLGFKNNCLDLTVTFFK